MAYTDIPNAVEKINSRAKDVPWYTAEVDKDVPARTLLETYSRIPPGEVESHVNTIVRKMLHSQTYLLKWRVTDHR